VRRALVASLAMIAPTAAGAQSPMPSAADPAISVVMRCQECGTIESIREIEATRSTGTPQSNPNTNTNASPTPGSPIGLIWYIPVGKGVKEEAYVGSVGNREWQERTQNTRYEFTVRMYNGNYQFAQKQGVSDLSVGERVKVSRGQIERWSQ